jgi:hypothetical protein
LAALRYICERNNAPTNSTSGERGKNAMIEVRPIDAGRPLAFEVIVRQGQGESRHRVTLAEGTLEQLAPGETGEKCVKAAFQFLLDREPKESILKQFDISVIPRYFPEFADELPRYLARP